MGEIAVLWRPVAMMGKRLPRKVDYERVRRRLYQIATDPETRDMDAIRAASVLLNDAPAEEDQGPDIMEIMASLEKTKPRA